MSAGELLPIALIGMGKMGRAIDLLATSHGCEVVARLGREEMRSLSSKSLCGARVAIEFTRPDFAWDNVRRLLAAGCPVVIGTTGWTEHLDQLAQEVAESGTPALWAPNFSVGVNIFLGIAEDVGRRLRGVAQFDAVVVETHHTAKKDAPSGTGLAIGQKLEAELGRPVPITSIRVGSVPGTHEVIFDAAFEQISFRHEARDRRVFADGALVAAKWLAAQNQPAVYTMRDVLETVFSSSGGRT